MPVTPRNQKTTYSEIVNRFEQGYMGGEEDFLAARSLTGFSKFGLPSLAKLTRQESPSKYFTNTTKTGIKAQCVSFIDKPLKRIPLYGAGVIFFVPTDKICRDIYGKLCIYDTDAGSQRQFVKETYDTSKTTNIAYLSRQDRYKTDELNNKVYDSLAELKENGPLNYWKYNELDVDLNANMLQAFMLNFEKESDIWFRPRNLDEDESVYRQKKEIFQKFKFNVLEQENTMNLLLIIKFYQLLGKDTSNIPIIEFQKQDIGNGEVDVKVIHREDLNTASFEEFYTRFLINNLQQKNCSYWDEKSETEILKTFDLHETFYNMLYSFIHSGPAGSEGELFFLNDSIKNYTLEELPKKVIAGIRLAATAKLISEDDAKSAEDSINQAVLRFNTHIDECLAKNKEKIEYKQKAIKAYGILKDSLKEKNERLKDMQSTNETVDRSPYRFLRQNIIDNQPIIHLKIAEEEFKVIFPKYALDGAWRIQEQKLQKQLSIKPTAKIMKKIHDQFVPISYAEGIKIWDEILKGNFKIAEKRVSTEPEILSPVKKRIKITAEAPEAPIYTTADDNIVQESNTASSADNFLSCAQSAVNTRDMRKADSQLSISTSTSTKENKQDKKL